MGNKERENVLKVVEHFTNSSLPITQEILDEYCNLNKIEKMSVGEYEDYKAQVKHDNLINTIFPLILAEVQKLRHLGEFTTVSDRNEIEKGNADVRINITKILENHNLQYRFVSKTTEELGSLIGQTVERAGINAFSKASDVLRKIAEERFGEEFHMGHAKQFVIDFYEKKTGTKVDPENK